MSEARESVESRLNTKSLAYAYAQSLFRCYNVYRSPIHEPLFRNELPLPAVDSAWCACFAKSTERCESGDSALLRIGSTKQQNNIYGLPRSYTELTACTSTVTSMPCRSCLGASKAGEMEETDMSNWPDSKTFWQGKRVVVTGGARLSRLGCGAEAPGTRGARYLRATQSSSMTCEPRRACGRCWPTLSPI